MVNTQDWEAKYPNYCRKCGAEGYISWTENLGPTGECWLDTMSDFCEACVLAITPKCPRCGGDWYSRFLQQGLVSLDMEQKLHPQAGQIAENAADDLFNDWLDKEESCPYCGWNWGHGQDDYRPHDPENDCPY
jgi:hypothetical protein